MNKFQHFKFLMSIQILCLKLLNTFMRFREFILLEQDPLGGGMGSPLGAPPKDPMGGAGAPPPDPMGGDPMGGGGMGDPMGGDPMGGEQKSQPVPTHADVWDVLDSLLNNKEIKKVKPPQVVTPPGGGDPMGGMGMGGGDPMGGGGMGGDPMGGMGAPPPMGGGGGGMGAPGPAGGGGGGPFLQG